jgi:hypothetical protein
MQDSLNTTNGGGTQGTTQDPQSATSDSSLNPTSQGNLQSGTINLFNGGNGVSLKPASLSTVNINASTSAKIQPVTTPVKHHSVNSLLLGIVIVVFVAAMVSFWRTTLAAKNTTE